MSSYSGYSSRYGGLNSHLPSKQRPTSSSKTAKNAGVSPSSRITERKDSHSSSLKYRLSTDDSSAHYIQKSHSFGGSSGISSTNGPRIAASYMDTVMPSTGNKSRNKVIIENEIDVNRTAHRSPQFGRRNSSPDRTPTGGHVSKTSSVSSNTSSTLSDRYTPSPSPSRSPFPGSILDSTRTTDKIKLNSNNSNSTSPRSSSNPLSHITDPNTPPVSVGMPTSAISTTSSSSSQYTPSSVDHTDTKRKSELLSKNKGLVGLRNLGNTCYMNSILQCLSATDSLTEQLLKEEKELLIKAKKNGIVKAYIDLLNEIWLRGSSMNSIAPMVFKQKVQRLAPMFQGYDQHDSQEFLRFLLSGLHDELNRAQSSKYIPSPSPTHTDDKENEIANHAWKRSLAYDNSVISERFMGQLKSTLKCGTCGNLSVTFDPFWDLSLPIPSQRKSLRSSDIIGSSSRLTQTDVSLDDCFKLFTTEENLDNDNKPLCEKCKSLQKSTKQLSIQKYPSVLVLHLKRFSGVHYRTKLSTLVKFKEEMFLSSNEESDIHYQLYAISNHSGSCYGGHYTAYCKHPIQGKWYQLNDSSVAPVSNLSIVSNQAYVLFYKKISSKTR